jgi:hypothetical protein
MGESPSVRGVLGVDAGEGPRVTTREMRAEQRRRSPMAAAALPADDEGCIYGG